MDDGENQREKNDKNFKDTIKLEISASWHALHFVTYLHASGFTKNENDEE